jgi:hypothetical protein
MSQGCHRLVRWCLTVPHNIYARTVLDHSIQTADGNTLWPDDGDAFLSQLCNRYCGSRFSVSEMEID